MPLAGKDLKKGLGNVFWVKKVVMVTTKNVGDVICFPAKVSKAHIKRNYPFIK